MEACQQNTIIFIKIKFCFKMNYADCHISDSYACRPVSVTYLLYEKRTKKTLQIWCCSFHTKSFPISTATEALKTVHFSLCLQRLSDFCDHSPLHTTFVPEVKHQNITCWRPKTSWNSTSRSSQSKPGASLFVSACHPPNLGSFCIV